MKEMDFETQLRSIASRMEYPRTPNVAGSVSARLRQSTRPRFLSKAAAWSLTLVLLLLSSVMLIPPARAAILEFIEIGIVRIFPPPVEPTAEAITTATPASATRPTATPEQSFPSLIPLLDQLAGETKLSNAQQSASYPILRPTYPSDLGPPDHIYVQDADGSMTILVWVDPQQPERVTMSLHFIPSGSWAISKVQPVVIQETEVNGERAIWAEGPYPLRMRNGELQFTRLIEGHVLIWEAGNITYRLETDLSLEEAIRIAESLEPIQ